MSVVWYKEVWKHSKWFFPGISIENLYVYTIHVVYMSGILPRLGQSRVFKDTSCSSYSSRVSDFWGPPQSLEGWLVCVVCLYTPRGNTHYRREIPCPPLSLCAQTPSGLNLCRPCAGCHSFWALINPVVTGGGCFLKASVTSGSALSVSASSSA